MRMCFFASMRDLQCEVGNLERRSADTLFPTLASQNICSATLKGQALEAERAPRARGARVCAAKKTPALCSAPYYQDIIKGPFHSLLGSRARASEKIALTMCMPEKKVPLCKSREVGGR